MTITSSNWISGTSDKCFMYTLIKTSRESHFKCSRKTPINNKTKIYTDSLTFLMCCTRSFIKTMEVSEVFFYLRISQFYFHAYLPLRSA